MSRSRDLPSQTAENTVSQVTSDAIPDTPICQPDNRTRAAQLRASGLSLAAIGQQLGITRQSVHSLLQTASRERPDRQALAVVEGSIRTLQQVADSTRSALADCFEIGAKRARRRIEEIHASDDDAAAKTVLETAKLATEGAAKVHGWGETGHEGAGRVSIQVVSDLRGLLKEQVVDVKEVKQAGEAERAALGE